MNPQKINFLQVCKEFEDDLAPRLKLSVLERAIYWHLFRHSRLEGRSRFRFSILWLARHTGVANRRVRTSLRWLIHKGVLRLIERSNQGHLVEVRLPGEIGASRANQAAAPGQGKLPGAAILDEMDFMRTRGLRQAIHAREAGVCFYCLRRTPSRSHCLDHVVPAAEGGSNSYRNLVSCCLDCNSQKSNSPVEDFLRELYRDGRLSHKELSGGLRKLQALAAGELRPKLSTGEDSVSAPDKARP